MRNIIAILLLTLSSHGLAGTQSAVPTCFSDKLQAPEGVQVDTELFVIIDQTTVFDTGLKQSVANNIKPFIKPGNVISVTQFSAFTRGHYTDVMTSVSLDNELAQHDRDDVSKPVLAKFDQCEKSQLRLAGQVIGRALKSAFGESSNSIDKSDVLSSLKDISLRVKRSAAKRKIVLLASDMLENSSISSFYAKQAVRLIDPAKELELVKKNGVYGDFGKADIYVIGAGLLAEDKQVSKSVYRSPQVIGALRSFWTQWFDQSNARLMDFGAPALLNQID